MIPPDVIAQIKDRIDIGKIVGETVRLQRRGRLLVGICPFHKEKTPSFNVNPERGRYHCFGCKAGGDAVEFLQQAYGLTFREAIEDLAGRVGIDLVDARTEQERREATAVKRSRDDLYRVNALAATFFVRAMRGTTAHPLARHALAELARRGLDSRQTTGPVAEVLQAFHVGYAPPGWDGLATYLRQQGVSPVLAEQVGLLVPRGSGSGHYDRFRHRLMFAVTDVQGRVVGFSGRALESPTVEEARAHGLPNDAQTPAKYMNSSESAIFTKGEHLFGLYQGRNAIRQETSAVVVEGNFDVVSLHARGICNVVAPLGTAFTESQARLVKRFAPSVVMLFDPDAAGRKATRASREPARAAGLDVRVARMPVGVDPDDLARRGGADGVLAVVRSARSMTEWLIDEALDVNAFGSSTLDEQRARVHAVARILAEEDDPTTRALVKVYADRVAGQIVVHGRALADLRALERTIGQATAHRADQPEPERHVETDGQAIVGALLDRPDLLALDDVAAAVDVLEGDEALAVAAIWRAADGAPGAFLEAAVAGMPETLRAWAQARLVVPVHESAEDAMTSFLRHADRLRERAEREALARTREELRGVASLGYADEETALLQQVLDRAKKRRRVAQSTDA